MWVHRQGLSQRCWVTLPRTGSRVTLTPTASFEDDRGPAAAPAPARGRTSVALTGPVAEPVPAADRARIERCGTPPGRVQLSFDDGFLSERRMEQTLAALEKANVKAWFYPTGGWAKEHPDRLERLRASGHHVGNHTATHPFLHRLTGSALDAEIAGGPAATGEPALMRPGFGAGSYTTRVQQAAADHGFGVCAWSTDTRDWAGRSVEEMTSAVLRGDAFTAPVDSGGVVLAHMTGRHTAEAIPGIVTGIRAKGLDFEPLR